MSDDAGRVWHTGNTDDAGRPTGTDTAHAPLDTLVVTVPQRADTTQGQPH